MRKGLPVEPFTGFTLAEGLAVLGDAPPYWVSTHFLSQDNHVAHAMPQALGSCDLLRLPSVLESSITLMKPDHGKMVDFLYGVHW